MVEYLDAHAKPPAHLRNVYKHYQKADVKSLDQNLTLLQSNEFTSQQDSGLVITDLLDLPSDLRQIFSKFLDHDVPNDPERDPNPKVFAVVDMPGLFVYPSLLPPPVQLALLEKLLHRDLSNPQHLTNLHLHYEVPYPSSDAASPTPASYFHPSSQPLTFHPKNPSIHNPLSTQQFLDRKLRWTTLGGQYDWTKKVYPTATPPAFPPDIKALIEDVFPMMRAEAAIVNVYSPGDTLSLHRDVSEECDRPLVSLSLGCDAFFIAGLESGEEKESADGRTARVATLRLRSGDAVLMSGESRYAWHGVPKVVRGTCPGWMRDWPAQGSGREEEDGEEDRFEAWRGWMTGKRINVNVRQMFA